MATPLLSAITADTDNAIHNIRLLADALIQQYSIRREEIKLCPSPFYLHLSQISSLSALGRSKATQTMPRRVYDALVGAAAQCTAGDIAKSNFVFEYARLKSFYLVSAYPYCLFTGNKIVLPHDVVFTVLYGAVHYFVTSHIEMSPVAGFLIPLAKMLLLRKGTTSQEKFLIGSKLRALHKMTGPDLASVTFWQRGHRV